MNVEAQDLQILRQLYFLNHLEPTEIKRAKVLLKQLTSELEKRI